LPLRYIFVTAQCGQFFLMFSFECARADAGDTPIVGHGSNSAKLSHCDEEALFPVVVGWIDVPHKDDALSRKVITAAEPRTRSEKPGWPLHYHGPDLSASSAAECLQNMKPASITPRV